MTTQGTVGAVNLDDESEARLLPTDLSIPSMSNLAAEVAERARKLSARTPAAMAMEIERLRAQQAAHHALLLQAQESLAALNAELEEVRSAGREHALKLDETDADLREELDTIRTEVEDAVAYVLNGELHEEDAVAEVAHADDDEGYEPFDADSPRRSCTSRVHLGTASDGSVRVCIAAARAWARQDTRGEQATGIEKKEQTQATMPLSPSLDMLCEVLETPPTFDALTNTPSTTPRSRSPTEPTDVASPGTIHGDRRQCRAAMQQATPKRLFIDVATWTEDAGAEPDGQSVTMADAATCTSRDTSTRTVVSTATTTDEMLSVHELVALRAKIDRLIDVSSAGGNSLSAAPQRAMPFHPNVQITCSKAMQTFDVLRARAYQILCARRRLVQVMVMLLGLFIATVILIRRSTAHRLGVDTLGYHAECDVTWLGAPAPGCEKVSGRLHHIRLSQPAAHIYYDDDGERRLVANGTSQTWAGFVLEPTTSKTHGCDGFDVHNPASCGVARIKLDDKIKRLLTRLRTAPPLRSVPRLLKHVVRLPNAPQLRIGIAPRLRSAVHSLPRGLHTIYRSALFAIHEHGLPHA